MLQTPQIQALAASDELAPHLTLLEIFSHGTYSSYTATAGLPALNDAQRLKLRQLSLLTLAKNGSSTDDVGSPALGYASLQKALDLPSRQALEELVISAIYAGLIKAQLNPKASLVQINSVSPLRDVAPTAIGGLLSSLQAWAGRCDTTLESLSSQMTQLQADADRRAARTAIRRDETNKLMENEQKGAQASTMSLAAKPRAAAAAAVSAAANTAVSAAANTAASRKNTRSSDIPPSNTHLARHPTAGSTHTDSGGGQTVTNNEMNPVLTVGDGSSFLQSGASSSAAAAHLQVRPAGSSGQMDGNANGGVDGDVAMEDEDGGPDGQKRAGKRKLEEPSEEALGITRA